VSDAKQRILLIDTCGDAAGVALCLGEQVMATEEFAAGDASAQIVGGVRRLLHELGWELGDLDAVGVVGGPGSFTGVRTGLAAAKGFCEAGSLKFAMVSRLAVLAEAASLVDGYAVLDAGRGEVYVRDAATGREWLASVEELGKTAKGCAVVCAEQRVKERLAVFSPVMFQLSVGDALPVVLQTLSDGGSDVSLAEANYVRGEQDIYAKPAGAR
jgi:tRNA threonylcarbamoyladenosine biosynthesis protein TsaB